MRWTVAAAVLWVLAAASAAQASSFSDIYTFCSQNSCADGGAPAANLVPDGAGNYFGTTFSGGSGFRGVVFELSPNGAAWTYTVVYSFCQTSGCPDGAFSDSPVILDADGDIFGTTRQGGNGHGTAFELVRKDGGWKFKLLYTFCRMADCADGTDVMSAGLSYAGQRSGASYDGISPLFGTTYQGGKYNNGTVFSLTPPALGKKKWKQKVIFDFCKEGNSCSISGSSPGAGVVVDSAQNLYGTTVSGGAGAGTVFQLANAGRRWKQTVLYRFCSLAQCADGGLPDSLVESGTGTLYGATSSGANQTACGGSGCGTLFKLVPNGFNSVFTVLHAFCTASNCSDGFEPTGAIQLLSNGDIVGATAYGGNFTNEQFGAGVVYRLSGSTLTQLHAFCASPGCPDGLNPMGGPVVDAFGDVLGTTEQGTANLEGAIYEIKP